MEESLILSNVMIIIQIMEMVVLHSVKLKINGHALEFQQMLPVSALNLFLRTL